MWTTANGSCPVGRGSRRQRWPGPKRILDRCGSVSSSPCSARAGMTLRFRTDPANHCPGSWSRISETGQGETTQRISTCGARCLASGGGTAGQERGDCRLARTTPSTCPGASGTSAAPVTESLRSAGWPDRHRGGRPSTGEVARMRAAVSRWTRPGTSHPAVPRAGRPGRHRRSASRAPSPTDRAGVRSG